MEVQNVIIIGGGCAGYSAAIYAGRAELKPLLIEGTYGYGLVPGGQLTQTTEIENYPGFVDGLNGQDLMDNMRNQAIKWNTKILKKTVTKVNFKTFPFEIYINKDATPLLTKSVIIATGATAKRLTMKGADTFWGKSISSCAICDAALPIYKDGVLFVAGGGDSAMEEAMYLTKFGSKVYIVNRSKTFRASKVMLTRAQKNPKIEFITDSVIDEVIGDKLLNKIKIKNIVTGEETIYDAVGLFYAIGHVANTHLFADVLELDEDKFIVTKNKSTETNIPGIFAAGDVQDKKYKQAVTACGSGCMAALDAERLWLCTLE